MKNNETRKCKICDQWFEKANPTHELCYDCYKKTNQIVEIKNFNFNEILEKANNTANNFDPRKKWKAENLCDDGHYVRSRAEMIIDNWLYHNEYVHAYEKSVFLPNNPSENLLSDFFLPKGKIHIEFWGIKNNEHYTYRKEQKIELYKKNNLNLISLNDDDLTRLEDKLHRKIHEFTRE